MIADNAATLFVDRPEEEGAGDRTALVTPAARIGYRELRGLVDGAARALRRLGVGREQRVALLLPDGPAFAAAFFGALKLGAVAVPLNTRLGAGDLRAILEDCGATVLVGDPALVQQAHAAGANPGKSVTGMELLAGRDRRPLAAEAVGADAMAFWLYTSGTTGVPKAVVHAHRTLFACRHYAIEVLGVTAEDRIFATSKLFFAYALGNGLFIPLFARACTYLAPDWPDAALVGGAMADYQPTLFFSVPTFYARLLRADLPPDVFASVRLCVSAGEPLPEPIYSAWRARFGVEILDGIGASETVFMFLSNRPRQSRPDSSGLPVPGTEARVLDDGEREVPDGAEGVLWIKTPSVAVRYWRRPEESRRAFVDGWFRTGDIYVRDRDGFHQHRGRADDFFKVAGQWVAPAAVESVLLADPEVAEAGVVGAAESGGLVKPFAFVVPREPGATGDLRARLLRRLEGALPPHQRPRDIMMVPELPRTTTGKLQRFKLRALVAGPPRAG